MLWSRTLSLGAVVFGSEATDWEIEVGTRCTYRRGIQAQNLKYFLVAHSHGWTANVDEHYALVQGYILVRSR
ncbi:hypothetical protein EV702DRAFT_1061788 [Suillus placidus]|uniref:Uncharacterized protein n=1 Tax=Suillus placidus TaxID=48579 RepID=A0A9P7D8X5_9AGAM|nr:hypothetical protein EV702DRAFT_1061788 [Suillus placidus]